MSFDDEALRRSNLLTLLEGHTGPVDDDMDELDIADRIMGASPMGHTGLEGKVSLRDQKWQNLHSVAPWSRINPPSALRGTLGGQQQVVAGQKLIVANWAADDDAEALPVTITMAPVEQVNPSGAHSGQNFSPYGIVQFGTRGFSVLAEVDIGKGVQFTVGASAVSVQVALPTDNAAPANQTTMKLAGMLSFYPVTRTVPVTRTIRTSTFDASRSYLIPAFSKSFTFWRVEQGSTVTLDVIDANSIIIQKIVVLPNTQQQVPVMLPTDAVSVLMSEDAVTHGRLIFELTF